MWSARPASGGRGRSLSATPRGSARMPTGFDHQYRTPTNRVAGIVECTVSFQLHGRLERGSFRGDFIDGDLLVGPGPVAGSGMSRQSVALGGSSVQSSRPPGPRLEAVGLTLVHRVPDLTVQDGAPASETACNTGPARWDRLRRRGEQIQADGPRRDRRFLLRP